MRCLWQNLRYSLRALRKNPGFTTVAILSLALGIGANVAIFTLINALLLRELPVPRPERLVELSLIPFFANSTAASAFSPHSSAGAVPGSPMWNSTVCSHKIAFALLRAIITRNLAPLPS